MRFCDAARLLEHGQNGLHFDDRVAFGYCVERAIPDLFREEEQSALLVSRVWLPLFYKAFDQWITFLRVAH